MARDIGATGGSREGTLPPSDARSPVTRGDLSYEGQGEPSPGFVSDLESVGNSPTSGRIWSQNGFLLLPLGNKDSVNCVALFEEVHLFEAWGLPFFMQRLFSASLQVF